MTRSTTAGRLTAPSQIPDGPAALDIATVDTDTGALIALAIENALHAVDPIDHGDHGRAYLVPDGYTLLLEDVRDMSDPVAPPLRMGTSKYVGVRSLAAYVNRYKTDATLGYIFDLNGQGPRSLLTDITIARYQLDDHPVDGTGHRLHAAELVLRPTTAARRWASALAAPQLDQEQLLDLVVDGIGEIADPDGATLRDLVADLHAIRTTSARSVIRTGGQATVELTENVALHSGTGTQVTVPETITIVFAPYAGLAVLGVQLTVSVKPRVTKDEKVVFKLDAPALDDEIARVVGDVAGQLAEATGIEPMWQP